MGDPLATARQQLTTAQDKYKTLANSARLNTIGDEIGRLSTAVAQMMPNIETARKRRYVFRAYLEHKAEVFNKHWDDIQQRVKRTLDNEVVSLRRGYSEVENALRQAEQVDNDADKLTEALRQFNNVVTRFESDVNAAMSRIRALFSTFQTDVDDAKRQLDEIFWICDQRDEASFPFLEGENVFLAARAEWRSTGKGNQDPDGILFLTDQRLIFEQKETVGKKLGIFGGKKAQDLAWEVPLHQIVGLEYENKGFFGGKDIIHFTLGHGARYPKLSVEVKGATTNKFWIAQIQRMSKGEVNDERAIPPDPDMLKRLSEAPTQCHVCGGTLPMLTAGQLQIECAYCGTIIRL